MKLLDIVLDCIFPPICGICGKIDKSHLCEMCKIELEKYRYLNRNYIKEEIFHLFKYKGVIREKIISYKFGDKSYLYEMFCEVFMNNRSACEFLKNYDIIIPVPIHKKRKRDRGFNQSELIAKKIATKLNLNFANDVLIKEKNTKPQSLLDRNNRIKNVQNVYKVQKAETIKGKHIVILDDIYTTGSTTKECKKMLIKAGASKVGIITIAKD